jgi:hypothetical protein
MPFKSQAQRRKFREMLAKGDISQQTYDEWEAATGGGHLPERVSKPDSKKRPRRAKAHFAKVVK